ncbi:hypothetical protein [Streptomyces noursei]|uniref:hypothetical protein n=1 Tax=Streptomyces noursei TaxID=1971 RepID=UPI000A7C90BF|nr:hypothetical protein [Streptomyces noursei]MCZ0975139.1 hypothetical protein [Streptomyces noursei]
MITGMSRSRRNWWTEIAIGGGVTVVVFLALSAIVSAATGSKYATMSDDTGWLLVVPAVAAGVWAAARYRRR